MTYKAIFVASAAAAVAIAALSSAEAQPQTNSLIPGITPYAPSRATTSAPDPSSSSVSPATGGVRPQGFSAPPTAATPSKVGYDYVLGSGDKLRVIVFGEETLSGEFVVAGNGSISFPLVGDIAAAGKTVTQVQQEIHSALANGYLKDPRVSAEVDSFRPYFVLGEVTKPGEYPYSDNITAMNAIAAAGGFSYRANHKYVYLKRATASLSEKVRLTDSLEIAPGDTIRVVERYF